MTAARDAHLHTLAPTTTCRKQLALDIVSQYLIGPHNMEVIYMSLDEY